MREPNVQTHPRRPRASLSRVPRPLLWRVPRPPAQEREGAAMFVVMLVLLMTTGVAIFAVHTTTAEIRAAGAARQALQTQYVAESGLVAAITYSDILQPAGVEIALERTSVPGAPYMGQFFEPEIQATKKNYRLYLSDFSTSPPAGLPIETDSARGPSLGRTALAPWFVVDINDSRGYTAPIAGHRADGAGTLHFMAATYTSRGRTRVPAAVGTDIPRSTGDSRPYLEGAADARAFVLLGPYAR